MSISHGCRPSPRFQLRQLPFASSSSCCAVGAVAAGGATAAAGCGRSSSCDATAAARAGEAKRSGGGCCSLPEPPSAPLEPDLGSDELDEEVGSRTRDDGAADGGMLGE